MHIKKNNKTGSRFINYYAMDCVTSGRSPIRASQTSGTFEQNRLFGQSELDDDRTIAEQAIKTANNREFTNALMSAKQISAHLSRRSFRMGRLFRNAFILASLSGRRSHRARR